MNRPYGFSASITPSDVFLERETQVYNGVEISAHGGLLEVGYDQEEDVSGARDTVRIVLNVWQVTNGVVLEVDLDHAPTWVRNPSGERNVAVSLSDHGFFTDRLRTVQETAGEDDEPVRVKRDSHGLFNNQTLIDKALKHEALKQALSYFSQEGLSEDRPLYGIYKAIEVITRALDPNNPKKGGRPSLGELAGQPKDTAGEFVNEVMGTANNTRHSFHDGRSDLSEQECRDRARLLILAYAESLA